MAINPLLLAGLALRKAKLRNAYLAFLTGTVIVIKGKIVMKETDESLRILKRLGINFNSYKNLSKCAGNKSIHLKW